jgi:hypothetical protein
MFSTVQGSPTVSWRPLLDRCSLALGGQSVKPYSPVAGFIALYPTLSCCHISGIHPHSEYPQMWHFMHPSANSSCAWQSGQVPMNVSPGS